LDSILPQPERDGGASLHHDLRWPGRSGERWFPSVDGQRLLVGDGFGGTHSVRFGDESGRSFSSFLDEGEPKSRSRQATGVGWLGHTDLACPLSPFSLGIPNPGRDTGSGRANSRISMRSVRNSSYL
jgi:hypothetical protein